MGTPGFNNNYKRKEYDFNRAVKNNKEHETAPYGLFIVTGATAISGQSYRWKYQIKPAVMDQTTGAGGGTPTTPGYSTPFIRPSAPTTGYDAYSVSEMSNNIYGSGATKQYSYGVPETDISSTSLIPVQIPIGTAVFAVGQKMDEGKFYYLIINTQAITGSC